MSRVSTLAPPVTWHGYRGSLADDPEPEPSPEAWLPVPERVLAALAALGGSATVMQVARYTEMIGAPLGREYTALTLRRLARLNPPAVTADGSPRGGAGRARRWYLSGTRCAECGYLPQARGHQETCGRAVAA